MLGSVAGAMSQPGAMTETDLELIVVLLALSCVAVGVLVVALRARMHLPSVDEIVAVRAAFDRMLLRKGLATAAHLDLIRHGIRARGVVTALRSTGLTREDHREVVLDLMVRRPHGGQFPAQGTTLVPVSAAIAPGSIVDTYYQPGDETAIAVCVPPG
jgi:hypothetical protein